MKKVLLIGGTGILGSCISRILKERNKDISVLIGSRDPITSNQIKIDINNSSTFRQITQHQIDIVVMCTTDPKDDILFFCINQGIDYLDTTKPNPQLIKSHQSFSKNPINSRIVFGSAWMGGVIPSVMKDFHSSNDIETLKLFIYYSLEDKAGKSAADFMAENVSNYFSVYENNRTKLVRHFEGIERYNFSFIKSPKLRTTYFDIPDLYILHNVEQIKNVVAKVAYSSNATNTALTLFQKLNLFKILSLNTRKRLFQSKGKGDITGFEICIAEKDKTTRKISIMHQDGQSELTAFSTCIHIEQLLSPIANGIYFSHQLYSKHEYTTKLRDNKRITIKEI